ncbi:MAG TPA: protein translocase subunit SecD [Phototrophicaceae bacterium]|nr:protein translocase subunit SecD [Phototrophicaceae bacterium]
MSSNFRWLIVVILLTAFAIWVVLPNTQGIHIDTDGDGKPDINLNVTQQLGLDLVGGLRILLTAQLPAGSYTASDLQQTANNVARRVDALGVTSPTVQVVGSNHILVELPGVSDEKSAIDTLQQTALLEFVDFSGLTSSQVTALQSGKILTDYQVQNQHIDNSKGERQVNPVTGQPFTTVITGADLQSAAAQLQTNNQWVISFQLTSSGSSKFGPFTAAHIGQPLAIVLDGSVLSAPVINSRLDTGGVIQGNFTQQSANTLALQLRSGALPIPLSVDSAQTVGATLGQESVNQSIRAGILGVVVVLLFMFIYYRVPGVAADLALLVFIVLNFAMFKLIPITLTLPAIIGFLISIGTAVDGNILIFERIKEELRKGSPLDIALDDGFSRAWKSIRDSNASTIIICIILFIFGQTPGASQVAGFALTLALGLVINLFTAVLVTRTFLHLMVGIARRPLAERTWLLGV